MTRPIEENAINLLSEAIDAVSFSPTEVQMKVKAKMLGLIMDNPIYSIEDLTLEGAIDLTKDKKLEKWWNIEGFQDWFKNRSEFKQRNEHLIALAQDALERILQSTNPKMAGAQVNAFKALIEVANKMPAKKGEVKFTDESINRMDPLQLEDYMKKAGYIRVLDKNPVYLDAAVVKEDTNEEAL